ncbi:MAG TPA: ATP-dependent DNA ligase [Planctomycetaceae bacterium]|nr:ATP-dependent DNA ligase [Planctomycetaceae bacterium]
MKLELKPPLPPMEALSVDESPAGDEWQYEPKWDGFRCLAFRDGKEIYLQSKSGQPLARYFPDLVSSLQGLPAKTFVLDGEIVIPVAGRLSFDDLLLRVHPAESRVRKLAAEHPALFIVFDLLLDSRGKSLIGMPLSERRKRLEKFAKALTARHAAIRLSPATVDLKKAQKWFRTTDGNLDGIVAKRLDLAYRSGERDGMQKIKHRRTADCVVGGFRYAQGKKVVGSLLLGLFDGRGTLNHVGFTSSFKNAEREKLTKRVERLIGSPGFTGRAPGGPSRWSNRQNDEWKPLKTKLVVEVEYDHFTGDRFRHGTRFLRWRPDKAPEQCTFEQVDRRRGSTLTLLSGDRRTA